MIRLTMVANANPSNRTVVIFSIPEQPVIRNVAWMIQNDFILASIVPLKAPKMLMHYTHLRGEDLVGRLGQVYQIITRA